MLKQMLNPLARGLRMIFFLPGGYHPKFSEDLNDNDVTSNEQHSAVKPRSASREQNLLHKDLKFNQQRYVFFNVLRCAHLSNVVLTIS